MNVAEPPFNDIHVRKAVEFAIDKQKLRRLRAGDLLGGGLGGTIAHHIFPDSLEGNLLFHYNPYATPNDNADLFKAKHEMSRSKYDQDHDGVCDKPACKNVLTIIDENPPYPDQANLIAHDLKPLGITLTVAECNRCTFMFPTCPDPTTHAALCPTLAWGKDYPDGFTFGGPLFSGKAILCPGPVFVSNACLNTTLVGAGPALLERYGYTTTQVPSVDPQIKRCERLVGDTRISCWAYLDKYLMEKVVPIVPLQFDNTVNVLARRVHCYSYDQFAGEVALDHLCVRS